MPFEEKKALAAAVVQSEMFGIKDINQALALMAICEAEGLHPARAVQIYHIIQGGAAIKADALLARFQEAGGSVQWKNTPISASKEHSSIRKAGVSQSTGRSIAPGRSDLLEKDNWRNYPRNMMRARCISEAVRAVYPGIATGIYTAEEVMDMDPQKGQGHGRARASHPGRAAARLGRPAEDGIQNGMTAYEDFWAETGKDQRKLIGASRHADYKAKAEDGLMDASELAHFLDASAAS